MRRALVTGGSSPLGSAICQQLAAEGMHVIVHSHVAIDRAAALVELDPPERIFGRDAAV